MTGKGYLRLSSGGGFIASLLHFFLFGNACASLCVIITEVAATAAVAEQPPAALLADSYALRQ